MRHHQIGELPLRKLLFPVVVAEGDDKGDSPLIHGLKVIDPGGIRENPGHNISREYDQVRFFGVQNVAHLPEILDVFLLILPADMGVCQLQNLESPLIIEA